MTNLPDIRRPTLRDFALVRMLMVKWAVSGRHPYQQRIIQTLMGANGASRVRRPSPLHNPLLSHRYGQDSRVLWSADFGAGPSTSHLTVWKGGDPYAQFAKQLRVAEHVGRCAEIVMIDDLGMAPRDAWKAARLGLQYGQGVPPDVDYRREWENDLSDDSKNSSKQLSNIVSRELFSFLQIWMFWATNGAPDHSPFSRSAGLCGSARIRTNAKVCLELMEIFERFMPDGGTWAHPFGVTEYFERNATRTQHQDPKRLAWVQARIDDYYRFNGQ